MYCLNVSTGDDPHVMAIQTIKDEQSRYLNIDCTRAEAVRKQQELVALSEATILLLMLWNTTLLKTIHSPGEMSV